MINDTFASYLPLLSEQDNHDATQIYLVTPENQISYFEVVNKNKNSRVTSTINAKFSGYEGLENAARYYEQLTGEWPEFNENTTELNLTLLESVTKQPPREHTFVKYTDNPDTINNITNTIGCLLADHNHEQGDACEIFTNELTLTVRYDSNNDIALIKDNRDQFEFAVDIKNKRAILTATEITQGTGEIPVGNEGLPFNKLLEKCHFDPTRHKWENIHHTYLVSKPGRIIGIAQDVSDPKEALRACDRIYPSTCSPVRKDNNGTWYTTNNTPYTKIGLCARRYAQYSQSLTLPSINPPKLPRVYPTLRYRPPGFDHRHSKRSHRASQQNNQFNSTNRTNKTRYRQLV